MPIRIPNDLPAAEVLQQENIFVMTQTRAMTQDIRPLEIVVLNLMPTKIVTETQLTRLLGNTPLQVHLELMHTKSYRSKNVAQEHLLTFYKSFEELKDRKFDGMVITGAPVEQMEFEDVDYWDELCQIMEWSKTNVHSTFHICWGAQAGLYYHFWCLSPQGGLQTFNSAPRLRRYILCTPLPPHHGCPGGHRSSSGPEDSGILGGSRCLCGYESGRASDFHYRTCRI